MRGRAVSAVHLSLMYPSEVARFLGVEREEALKIIENARRSLAGWMPEPLSVKIGLIDYYLPPGLHLIIDKYGLLKESISPAPFIVPDYLDEEFVRYVFFELPKLLERERRCVFIEDLDERFIRHARQGLVYMTDLLKRISTAYNIQVVVTGSPVLEDVFEDWVNVFAVYRRGGGVYVLIKPDNIVHKIA